LDNAFSGVSKFGNCLPNSEEQVFVQYDTNEPATLFPLMSMSAHTFTTLFICIEPFKATLLSCLAPFDIAKLLAAIRYEPTPWERKTHMNVLDDIFEDAAVFKLMIRRGLTVRIIGADVETLRMRLHYPCSYLASTVGRLSIFHIFVVVADQESGGQRETLFRDYRDSAEKESLPVDLSHQELRTMFDNATGDEIAKLSRWILCAPHLMGTMSSKAPGWIPIFSARPHFNVRAYMSTFNNRESRLLHIDRNLMTHLLGNHNKHTSLLCGIPNLMACCLKMAAEQTIYQQLPANLTMNALHKVYAAEFEKRRTGMETLTMVHTMHSVDSCIAIRLE
jgi:hypothetical protein